jgi:hypothetical protein
MYLILVVGVSGAPPDQPRGLLLLTTGSSKRALWVGWLSDFGTASPPHLQTQLIHMIFLIITKKVCPNSTANAQKDFLHKEISAMPATPVFTIIQTCYTEQMKLTQIATSVVISKNAVQTSQTYHLSTPTNQPPD